MAQEPKRTTSNREAAERALDAGLRLLSADDLKPGTPCPDSWTFALYVQGRVDEETRRKINSHMAFCNECYPEYLALAEPEDIMKEVERELHSTTATPPERSADVWRRLMEQLRGFVIDLGKAYAPGTLVGAIRIVSQGPGLAVKGRKISKRRFKVLEVGVGDNTYSVELGVRKDGALSCDIAGHQTPHKTPLYLALRLESGEAVHVAHTSIHGNAHFVLPEARVPHDVGVLDLNLEGAENQIAFRMPQEHAPS